MNAIPGEMIKLEDLGPVQVVKILPSGAAVVKDINQRKWLVATHVLAAQEITLFSFVPDVPAQQQRKGPSEEPEWK